jgi:hypothetical protein
MSVDVAEMRSTPPGYFTVRWGLPEYTDWMDESMSWKETCYIGDWSFLWERRYRGPDVLKLFSDISVNSFAKFDIGQSKHVIHTDKNGKVIHEGILSRLDTEEFLLFGRGCLWADYNLRHGKYNANSEPDDLFNLQVSGPNAIYLLEKASAQSLREVKFMHSGKIRIAGVEMLALRQGMAGEIAFELQGPIKFREQVTNAVMEAGKEFGIRKLGGRAVFINHLEACFPTIITDYCPAMFDDDMAEYRAEFQAAMASRQHSTSRAVLREIRSVTGIAIRSSLAGPRTSSSTMTSLAAKLSNPRLPIRSASCVRWCGTPMTSSMSTLRFSAMTALTTTWKCRATSADSCMPIKSRRMARWSASRRHAATAIISARCYRSARSMSRVASRDAKSLLFGGSQTAQKKKSAPKLHPRPTKLTTASST